MNLPNLVRSLFSLLVLFALSTQVHSLNLYLDPFEGGKIKDRHQNYFKKHMKELGCDIQFAQAAEEADLLLAIPSTISSNYRPFLSVDTFNKLPLNLSIMVKSSRAVDSLEQLKGEAIAIIHPYAQMGFLSGFIELAAQGFELDESTVFESGRYDGALALLLHGDVFAAAIPHPLAEKWKTKNKLSVLAQSTMSEMPQLWINKSIQESEQDASSCATAFLKLKNRERRDKRFAVFPMWVEGFSSL